MISKSVLFVAIIAAAAIAIIITVATLLGKGIKRGMGGYEPGYVDPETAYHDDLHDKRIAMHNRYMPGEANSSSRQEALVDQIVADQRIIHAEPGEIVHAPAPGEHGYIPPSGRLCVTVGDMTIIIRRDGPPLLVERTSNGAVTPEFEIPIPWDDVVTNLAFEIACRG